MSYMKVRRIVERDGIYEITWSLEKHWRREPMEDMLHHAEHSAFGLDPGDIPRIKLAVNQYVREKDLGRKVPGIYHEVGERVE